MKKINKEELLNAVDTLENEYDAYYTGNKYGNGTHPKEFKLLSTLKGDKVQNALDWIHDCYDCFYKGVLYEDSPFNYLRKVINDLEEEY